MRTPAIWTLTGGGTRIAVTNRGASWLSCVLALPGGATREVLLAHDKPQQYGTQPGYLGGIVGRYANRIAGARLLSPQGQTHALSANEGCTQLHGGPDGFDKRDWQMLSHDSGHVRFRLDSPAGDQGYPGHLQAEVTYEVGAKGSVTIRFDTVVDVPCPVGLSSHGYFNLDGNGDQADVLDHTLWINAERYLPVNVRMIPTGEFAPVAGTPFDFSTPARLRDVLKQQHPQGLAGAIEVAAVHTAANASVIAGLGYTGILVAFVARHNPWMIPPVALLFGGFGAAGSLLQRRLGLPDASVLVLQGFAFVLILASEALRGRLLPAPRAPDGATPTRRCRRPPHEPAARPPESGLAPAWRDSATRKGAPMTGSAWLDLFFAIVGGAIRVGTPFLFVSLGECLTEKSGRINLGLEGVLVFSAMAGFGAAYLSGSPWLGVLAAAGSGALLGLLHGLVCSLPRVSDIATGIALDAAGHRPGLLPGQAADPAAGAADSLPPAGGVEHLAAGAVRPVRQCACSRWAC